MSLWSARGRNIHRVLVCALRVCCAARHGASCRLGFAAGLRAARPGGLVWARVAGAAHAAPVFYAEVMTGSDEDAYAHVQRQFDRLNAELAPHIHRVDWDVGFLVPDPLTGAPPGIGVETAGGAGYLELAEATGCAYAVCSHAAVLEMRSVLPGPEEIVEAPWHVIEMVWPFARYRYLGAVVTGPPLTLAGTPAPAGALAVGSDGESLFVDAPTGPDRWLLMAGFGYRVSYERDHRAWLVSEMRDGEDDSAEILGA